ncbi:MAG: ATPase, T2SS/T4P/T4SS family [Pseudomonadota bacterium]
MNENIITSKADLMSVIHRCRPLANRHLGRILREEGMLTDKQLDIALARQSEQPGTHLGDILVEMHYCTRAQITTALSSKLGIPYIKLDRFEIPPEVLHTVPADLAMQHRVLPLAKHNNHLIVAMENPLNLETMELLRFHTNYHIDAVITSGSEISGFLQKYNLQRSEAALDDISGEMDLIAGGGRSEELDPLQSVAQEAQKKPIVRLVNAIIAQGIQHHASDIHIRPGKERVYIYYRIDGKLQFSRTISRALLPALVSRIKITGRMDIAERRLPQDGHSRVEKDDNTIDLRISVIPTLNGESVVIRILDKRVGLKALEELGLSEAETGKLRRLTSRSYGMFLVTGPTGAGKSTTLYAILEHIRKRNPHIITVEDPAEYDMDGIEQIQIAAGMGYTFAQALRHILRHDPDVVMLGEIRDLETAHIANKAALTGHLLLSSLHTNDAAGAVTRLIDMGIEPYLLSSTLLGVMAQRLVRLNCPHCLKAEQIEEETRQRLGLDSSETFYRGEGCSHCNNTGYQGRSVVCELLEITPHLANLINKGAGIQAIKHGALKGGMKSLGANALGLARQKRTSIEEVLSVSLE